MANMDLNSKKPGGYNNWFYITLVEYGSIFDLRKACAISNLSLFKLKV
jgi:hypothetical protein